MCFNFSKEDSKKSNIVYKMTFPCGAVYIGRTKEQLNVRMSKHLYDAKHPERNGAKNKQNLVYSRIIKCVENNQPIQVSVLEHTKGNSEIRIKKMEIVHIKRYSKTHESLNVRSV